MKFKAAILYKKNNPLLVPECNVHGCFRFDGRNLDASREIRKSSKKVAIGQVLSSIEGLTRMFFLNCRA